jgi:hypothetical protein
VLRDRGQQLLLELGQVLHMAKALFEGKPQQYWLDWLAVNELKPAQATQAIAAFQCVGLSGVGVPPSLLPLIARAGDDERSFIRAKVQAGAELTAVEVRSILREFKTLCVGRRVFLADTTLVPGGSGTIEMLDGESVVVALDNGDRIPCFIKEVSVRPYEQLSLEIPKDDRSENRSKQRIQLLEEEIAFLRPTIFIIFQSDQGWRGDLMLKHPNIEEWALF